MRRSLNEIIGEMRKAALGAGFPVGHAQELSSAAGWLVAKRLDGVQAFLSAIGRGYDHAPPKLAFVPGSGGRKQYVLDYISAASHGSGLRDLIHADAGEHSFTVQTIDEPHLLMALLVQNTVDTDRSTDWFCEDGSCLNLSLDLVSEDAQKSAKTISDNSGPVQLHWTIKKAQQSADQFEPMGEVDGHEIDEELWLEVKALAAKTYVPASEASRIKGAGAAINDND